MDLDELARAYWAAPPYDEHDHSEGFEKHPFDLLQDLQLDADDDQLSGMLRALALSAPTERDLASVGTQWVSALEYKFDAEVTRASRCVCWSPRASTRNSCSAC